MELISVIVTVRNEEKFIIPCLNSINAFDLPSGVEVEIFVIDGMSTDKTWELVNDKACCDSRIRIISNPRITQAAGVNLGILNSRGNWIAWLGAHSVYPKDYLGRLFAKAKQTKADYTGGVINTIAYNNSCSAALVQALTTHRFGVGGSGFRTNAKDGPADTASYGLFNRQIFYKIGLFDERLVRAQDFEYNSRIRQSGGVVWLDTQLIVDYYNQPNLLKFLKKQLFKEAPYNAFMWYLAPYTFTYRHAITSVFTIGVIGGLFLSPFSRVVNYIFISAIVLYFFLAVVSALQQAKRYKNLLHVLTLPISFFLYHFLHGLGVLCGIFRLVTGTSPVQKIKEPWEGYGSYRIKINKSLKK